MNIITPQNGFELVKEGALLLDVRSNGEFLNVYAEKAFSFPLDLIRNDLSSINPLIEKYSKIAIICQTDVRAKIAFDILSGKFKNNFYVIEGGTKAWIENNLPINEGKGPISIERQVRIIASAIIVIGSILAFFISKWFLLVPFFVGAGLLISGITGWCGMGLFLAKMPWNK